MRGRVSERAGDGVTEAEDHAGRGAGEDADDETEGDKQ
jgi:hypothetical protein